MITSIKNADYSFLFQEASEKLVALHNAGVLQGAQALTEDEIKYLCPTDENGNFLKDENGNQIINRFTSLEQYFTRLGTLISNVDNPIKYLMLPLDEDPLEVDANTRTITVPANFKKSGVGVQGDIIAETLFLRIDRFFDYMDFLDAEAYVQWKLPDGKEGASIITHKDYESEHSLGKLILVWPLTGAVTEQTGNLQFSLRFIRRSGNEIVYSWNSLPCTISIKSALKADMDYADYDVADALFLTAIKDSSHTSKGDDVTPPEFTADAGFGFTQSAVDHLLAKANGVQDANSMLMEAAAFITDQGRLTYEWEYRSLDGQTVYTGGALEVGDDIKAGVAYRLTEDEAAIKNKTYYKKNGNVYVEYDVQDFADDKGKGIIYERYAFCRIANGDDRVTGLYTLTAVHKLGFDSEKKSISVKIPGPEKLDFTKGDKDENDNFLGLPLGGVFIKEDGSVELETAVVTDGIDANKAYQSVSYDWRLCETAEDGVPMTIDGVANAPKVTIANAKPGWYEVGVTSMLNRDTISKDSCHCRVTKEPVAPKLAFPDDPSSNKDYLVYNSSDYADKKITLEAELSEAYPAPLALHCDDLVYEWKENGVLISAATHPTISGQGTATLVIDAKDMDKAPSMSIQCTVTNRLNGHTASSTTGTYIVNFV